MKNEFPQRKSPRAKWCEYNEGLYFVTDPPLTPPRGGDVYE